MQRKALSSGSSACGNTGSGFHWIRPDFDGFFSFIIRYLVSSSPSRDSIRCHRRKGRIRISRVSMTWKDLDSFLFLSTNHQLWINISIQVLTVNQGIPGFIIQSCFTGLYWALQCFTGFYWILLSFTGFYWVLLGFTGFY